MTQIFTDVPDTETLKLSREPLTTRDVTARTMNSGTTLPSITDSTYEDMLGMNVFRTDELINKQFTEYDEPTSTATWTPILNGPTSAVSGNAALFDGTTGGKIKDSGIALPSGDVVGTTDTQTLTNKTLSNLTSPIALADGGTGQTSQTAGFDALSPISAAGGIISSDGTNNIAITAGADGQILSADSSESSGLKWISQASGGGLELEIETADFTFESGKRHYVNSTSAIEATFPATVSVGDRFAIVTGLSDDVSIMTNASAATQSLIGADNDQSSSSDYSAITCGKLDEKMICVEFVTVSASEFAGYVNDITVIVSDTIAYFAGGKDNVPATLTNIDKLTFSTEAISVLSATLSSGYYDIVGVSSIIKAYFGGRSTTINTVSFADDTSSYLSSAMSDSRYGLAGANSSTSAYFAGGYYSSSSVDTIDALVFASETSDVMSETLSSARRFLGGAESSLKGYFAGGYVTSFSNRVDALVFATETCASNSSSLTSSIAYLAGANSSTNAYFAGGSTGRNIATCQKMDFDTETCSNIGTVLSSSRRQMGPANSSTSAYFAGGQISVYTEVIDELVFSSGSHSALSAVLSEGYVVQLGGANN